MAPILGLGFNDTDRLLVQKEDVIGRADISLVRANSDADTGVEIQGSPVLNEPPRLFASIWSRAICSVSYYCSP